MTYIGEATPEVEDTDAKELCFPEKCCGRFIELFSGSTCNASLSLSSHELLPYPGIQVPCTTYIKPATRALWQCDKDKNGMMSETDPYRDTCPSHEANDACYIF